MQDDIKIHCTDNDKLVEAKIVNQTDGWLTVVLQPGDIKLDMKKTKLLFHLLNLEPQVMLISQDLQ